MAPAPVVLLVDPDAPLRERVAAALRRRGCVVETYADGIELVGRRDRASLVVLCIDPPKRGGWAICSKVRKSPTLRQVPLIVTTAEASDEDIELHRKLQTHADEYLRKPFMLHQLVERVAAFVGGLPVSDADGDDPGVAPPAGSGELPSVLVDPSINEHPSQDISLDDLGPATSGAAGRGASPEEEGDGVLVTLDVEGGAPAEEDPLVAARPGGGGGVAGIAPSAPGSAGEQDFSFNFDTGPASPPPSSSAASVHGGSGVYGGSGGSGAPVAARPGYGGIGPSGYDFFADLTLEEPMSPPIVAPSPSAPPPLAPSPLEEELDRVRVERDHLLRVVEDLRVKGSPQPSPGDVDEVRVELGAARHALEETRRHVVETQSRLDDAQREASALRARLVADRSLLAETEQLRAELVRRSGEELDAALAELAARHQRETQELQRWHEQVTSEALAEERARGASELARVADEHAAALARVAEEHAAERARVAEEHTAELARVAEAHAAELARVAAEHAAELAHVAEEKAAAVAAERTRVEGEASSERARLEGALARAESAAADAVDELRARGDGDGDAGLREARDRAVAALAALERRRAEEEKEAAAERAELLAMRESDLADASARIASLEGELRRLRASSPVAAAASPPAPAPGGGDAPAADASTRDLEQLRRVRAMLAAALAALDEPAAAPAHPDGAPQADDRAIDPPAAAAAHPHGAPLGDDHATQPPAGAAESSDEPPAAAAAPPSSDRHARRTRR